MDDSRSTYSVLVVSAAAKFHTSLRELLPEDRYAPLCASSSVAEARRVLLERPFDIVIISAPLPDEFGTKLALHIIDKSSAGVLLLVKAEHYPDLPAAAAAIAPAAVRHAGAPAAHGAENRYHRGENGGDTAGEPRQMAAHRPAGHDGAGRAPLYRKAGHGSLRHPPRRGGGHPQRCPLTALL